MPFSKRKTIKRKDLTNLPKTTNPADRQDLLSFAAVTLLAIIFATVFLLTVVLGWTKVANVNASQLKQCAGANVYQTCQKQEGDQCSEWSDLKFCSTGYACLNGQCIRENDCFGDCSWRVVSQCLTKDLKQVCQDYDSQTGQCRKWSQAIACTGGTSCGYGKCSAQEKPDWKCQNGQCVYSCQYSSRCADEQEYTYLDCSGGDVYWFSSTGRRQEKHQECRSHITDCDNWGPRACSGSEIVRTRTCWQNTCQNGKCLALPKVETEKIKECASNQYCQNGLCFTCQCREGPCCDGCNYKPDSTVCNTAKQVIYGCPWGVEQGSGIGQKQRAQFQYCSGNSSQCDGSWTAWSPWSNWLKTAQCASNYACSWGQPSCQAITNTHPLPASPSQGEGEEKGGGEGENSQPSANSTTSQSIGQHKGLAFTLLAGLGRVLTNWLFWLFTGLAAVACLMLKIIKFTDWLAKKKLEKISAQYTT